MDIRVKYYPSNDWCYGHNLSKIETLQIPPFETITVNDAIEFYEIQRYFAEGARSKVWSDEDYDNYRVKSDNLSKLTKRFFNQINNDNIIDIYNDIELGYDSDFWALFDNCKLYNKISDVVFAALISGEKVSPRDLFLHKGIVRKYGSVLRQYILDNEYCISILLYVYEQNYTQEEKMTLPSELSGEDRCAYFENYIDSDHPNTNHLRTIIEMHPTKEFPITDEIRLKAKRRFEVELENISNTGFCVSQRIQLSFNSEQDEVKIDSSSDNEFAISYSLNWLLETLDYPSILNNFIYIFEFVDFPQMRCAHVNRMSQAGVLERAFASKSSQVYPHNYAFALMQGIASMQMNAYYDFLEKQGVHLENVIKWYFTEQLQEEFGCSEIRLSMPSINSSYAEKCSSIITAFESILKQYSLYVKKGDIDFELVGMSTTPVRFEDIKSLVPDKYIYGIGEDYKRLAFWLFSDQCMFSNIERIYKNGRHYNCLIDLLLNETIFVSDYRENERGVFENMASFDLITIGDDGKINLKDKTKLAILRDLYRNDVISKKHYPLDASDAINDFIAQGIIESESTLFSRPEINYLNYLLNRAEYCNGLEIRNRYIHGIQQVNTNEDEHRQNYYILLRLFILLAIKVNDEFCLKEEGSI